MQQKAAHLIQRYNTAAIWSQYNPILLDGEIGIESDTNKVKLGDGHTRWDSLDYCINMAIVNNYTAGDGIIISFNGVLSRDLLFDYILEDNVPSTLGNGILGVMVLGGQL